MVVIFVGIELGDEVIVLFYIFVFIVNVFVFRGVKIVFVDFRVDYLGMDEDKIEVLIIDKIKVIVLVYYVGVVCDMDKIMVIVEKYNFIVIEDVV